MANSSWQDDWNHFVDVLSECVRSGDGDRKMAALFSGKDVVWTGMLQQKRLSDIVPSVVIMMPRRVIDCGDGRTAILDGISVPAALDAVESWERIETGSEVRYRATLIGTESFLPSPIDVKRFADGLTIVLIFFKDGAPVARAGPAIRA